MTLRNRIRFYQQMATMANAGVPIRTALQRLETRITTPETKKLLASVEAGNTLAESFSDAGFTLFEVHLISAGERTAQLGTVFTRLSEFWDRDRKFGEAIVRQLIYPIALGHLGVIVSGLLVLSQGVGAVITTIIVGLVSLYSFGFVAYALVRFTWSSAFAQRFWLAIPLIGGALKAAYAYRWITALRLEFAAGVPFSDAVADAWRASGFIGGEARADEALRDMRSGVDLSELIVRWRQLPRDWIDYFHTAEISGEYDQTFRQVETEAAHVWTQRQDRMSEWVPKILYFIILLFIAYKIIGMWKGIYSQTADIEKTIDDVGR